MLKGKVAVITGGTRGIGFETAKKFLSNGAKVVVLGSKSESVNHAIDELKSFGEVMGAYPRLENVDEVKSCFQSVYEKYNKIDILINNAGVSSSTALLDYTAEEVNKIIDINLKAVFNCCQAVVPFMKDGGVIVNASSMVGTKGQARGALYPATKGAINMLTKSLAKELASLKIRVNAVAPGVTNTDMVKVLPKPLVERLLMTIPLGRVCEPDEIADAYLYLCSDMASYVTGTIIEVDGGCVQ